MNSITIAGRITKDAELRHTANGDAVLSFSVADNQRKDDPAIFWNCSLFGRRAEALSAYVTKGQQVTVAGTVSEREWTDREGNKRKSMDVRVNEIALQGGRRDDRPAAKPAPRADDGMRDDLDQDIPF